MNFFLAIFWLVLGIGLLVWEWLTPGQRFLKILDTGISLGWFALALAGYNLLRWWFGAVQQRDRKVAEEIVERRRRRALEEPNPDFDFSESEEKNDHIKEENQGWFKKGGEKP